MSVAQVAAVLNAGVLGRGDPNALVLDVVVDSRAVRTGTLFVALPGERVDGHDFVATALASGAVAALTAHPMPQVGGAVLVVADPLVALGKLARHVVDTAAADGLRVVGITGSQGKTSTKDLLAQVLERAGETIAPHGNLNNELGVPLTATRIGAATRFLVAEMGARGIGHIAYLCSLTPPHVGLVLNVGQAHVGEFGSQQAIAQAKGELVEALGPDGTAILNADDPLVWAMRHRTVAPVLAFAAEADPLTNRAVWASGTTSDDLGRCRFRLHSRDGDTHSQAEVELRLSGRHHVVNAVAAAAVALALGVDLGVSAGALSKAGLRSRSRMDIRERGDDVVVIDDAYNANPDSTRAALDTLAEIGRARRRRRTAAQTWAVLGDMLELGDTAEDEHLAIGAYVARSGIDRLVAVGELGPALAAGAADGGMSARAVAVPDKRAVAGLILPQLRPGDTILVKASRGLALDTVADEIWTASPALAPRLEPARDREDPA